MPKIQVDAQGRPLDENGDPIVDPIKKSLMNLDDYLAKKLGPEQQIQVPMDATSSQNFGRVRTKLSPRQYVGVPENKIQSYDTSNPPTTTAQEGAGAGYFAGYPKVDAMDKAAAMQELNNMKSTTEYPVTDQEAAELRRQALMKKAGY